MLAARYIRHIMQIMQHGRKLRIGNHSFIIIKGLRFYYIYKRCEKSIIRIENIEC